MLEVGPVGGALARPYGRMTEHPERTHRTRADLRGLSDGEGAEAELDPVDSAGEDGKESSGSKRLTPFATRLNICALDFPPGLGLTAGGCLQPDRRKRFVDELCMLRR
jgi:hypothetical protein